MNTMCRNIIEKSVIGVLIYAGKRFVDKCFFDKKNEKKEKEVMLISNIIDKDIKNNKKYNGSELRNKIYNHLISQGYSKEKVINIINTYDF